MAQRIPNHLVSNSLLPYLSSSPSTSLFRLTTAYTSSSLTDASRPASRSFSTTRPSQTKLRREMIRWLRGKGSELQHHTPGETNYITHTNKPFPGNPLYRSDPILSEDMRNEIHRQVTVQNKSVRAVSVQYSVDMRRVAAVVRLVELENQMKEQGKSLALPYARAIHEMVPVTHLREHDDRRKSHETINDLPVHRLTDPQIFYPVSESRQFNRIDAGRVFSAAPALRNQRAEWLEANPDETIRRITQESPANIEKVGKGDEEHQVLLPADARIPHPHMITHERNRLTIGKTEPAEVRQKYRERLEQETQVELQRKERAQQRLEMKTQKVQPENSRFEFRFTDVVVSRETTGLTGRGHKAPGRRYGVPSSDRKKGQVKIPTRVKV
ncbi:mitochondrial 37S ribosomal protein mS45 [Aspergillus brunneoviolaceus CBS 621.78]|uniref:Ribosomal protein S35, mitochondrial n=2 Tax=Aspergillus TaxID=5052 RepID=A0A8G1RFK8_9EURO|nr:hypothetical protein BO95DRAFT_444270 [Aspergillus brunneoviolaceus CBS 621.78]XP_040795439.1 uncharacterized protein BO72DRAFT_490559 [Aspergillus fijiensis CBS 313.89]RAH44392.1 hypothetical protein BO95DRAFT_444270 [Aspergillus brunneoviolaceus CBS 621.78]RAK71427.1 hypothetical protein BO72DRAFT_490559 [Aspergillus fijiensis CBS 313.89]